MIESFLEVIRNVGIFIICAQAVMHFRPKASYEKYLKVLLSIIVLVMLMTPCFQALGNMESFLDSLNRYEDFLGGQVVWEEYNTEAQKETEYTTESIETIVIEPVGVID